jgi:uncharacterized repeat protein (TIGR01451 family)
MNTLAKLSFVTVASIGVALIAVSSALQPISAAGPWYVALGGSDNNTCLSSTQACASINGALNKPGFVAGDTILVATGVYTGTGDEVVLLNKSAILSGGWDATFTAQSDLSTLDGQHARRDVTVFSNAGATVDRFIITNGYSDYGGGLSVSGTLTLTASVIAGNGAGHSGGGISIDASNVVLNHVTVSNNTSGYGGGINVSGTLTLTDSVIIGNWGLYTGGGINIDAGVVVLNQTTVGTNSANLGGGIYNNGSSLTVNHGAITANTALVGAGVYNEVLRTVILNDTVVNNNTATMHGGGGLYNYSSSILIINNSTISGNSGSGGGGMHNGPGSTLSLNSSTVSHNQAREYGGGGLSNSGAITMQNTIIAGNTAVGGAADCSFSEGVTSLGYNLIGSTVGCTFIPAAGDLTNVDAKLGALDPAGYHPLRFGSPAINAGNPAACSDHLGNPLAFDQRGLPRVDRCDIGAVEMQALEPSVKLVSSPIVPLCRALTYTIVVRNIGSVSMENIVVSDTVPVSLTYQTNSLNATEGTYGYSSGTITWTGSISAGTTVTITFGARADQVTLGNTPITNTAIISGDSALWTRAATFTTFQGAYLPMIIRD